MSADLRARFEAYGKSKGWKMIRCEELPDEYDWPGVQGRWETVQAIDAAMDAMRATP